MERPVSDSATSWCTLSGGSSACRLFTGTALKPGSQGPGPDYRFSEAAAQWHDAAGLQRPSRGQKGNTQDTRLTNEYVRAAPRAAILWRPNVGTSVGGGVLRRTVHVGAARVPVVERERATLPTQPSPLIHPSIHPPSSHAGTNAGPVTSSHLAADGLSDPAVTTGHDAAQRCASTGRAAGDPPLADAVFALTERSKWKEAFRPRARPVCLDRAAGDPRSRDSRRGSVCSHGNTSSAEFARNPG